MPLFLGIDFGTSGARAIVIDSEKTILATVKSPFPLKPTTSWASVWQTALWSLLEQLPDHLSAQIRAIALNGTSGTVLLCDRNGQVLTEPLLYNDSCGASVLDRLSTIAPPEHVVLSASSSLAKLLWWHEQGLIPADTKPVCLLHQADWLAFLLHGQPGISDYHNALKLGYDVGQLCYPNWLRQLPIASLLPQVVTPGTPLGTVRSEIAAQFNLYPDCRVCAGTTDSIAAFLASGAQKPGEAVTSLGSTLVLKLLSQTRVDASQYGVYSHRLGDQWLVGGASNTGGAVFRQYFSEQELMELSRQICPEQESPLDYYPLVQPGERFPVNDPQLQPRLQPKPDNPVAFLHGLLEGMARIEARGYQLLQDLGATPLTQVYTAGGGAQNQTWNTIRARQLGVPTTQSAHAEAAYGTALLAMGRRVS